MNWLVYACGSAFFAGLTAVLAKAGIKKTDSNLATAIRTIVVFLFAWMIVRITGVGNQFGSIGSRSMIYLILSGAATGVSWLCYYRALQLGDVNKVAPIDKSSTVLTMILAIILLHESLNMNKMIAMVLIFGGMLLMITKTQGGHSSHGSKTWMVYAILSAVFASLTTILAKLGVEGVDSNLATAIRTGVVLIMAWIVVFVTGGQKKIRSMGFVDGVFLILSGAATGASWLCYYRALSLGEASRVAPIDKFSIVVSVVFSCIFLKERLSAKALFGLVLLVAGLLLLCLNVPVLSIRIG